MDLDLGGELRGVSVGLIIRLGDDKQLGVSFCTLDAISRVMKGDESLAPVDAVSVSLSKLVTLPAKPLVSLLSKSLDRPK